MEQEDEANPKHMIFRQSILLDTRVGCRSSVFQFDGRSGCLGFTFVNTLAKFPIQ